MKLIEFSLKIFVIIALLFACEREDTEVSKLHFTVIDTTEKKEIQTYNPKIIIVSSGPSEIFKLDINSDGVDDLEFIVDSEYSKFGVDVKKSVKCLHQNIKIAYEIHTDTIITYLSTFKDTTQTELTLIYNADSIYESISNLHIDDLFCPQIFNHMDTIHDLLNWQSGILTFSKKKSFRCLYGPQASAYECYPQIIKDFQQGTWINIEDKYIGVKLINYDADVYGWIQISNKGSLYLQKQSTF